jgi:hypothetical protein
VDDEPDVCFVLGGDNGFVMDSYEDPRGCKHQDMYALASFGSTMALDLSWIFVISRFVFILFLFP